MEGIGSSATMHRLRLVLLSVHVGNVESSISWPHGPASRTEPYRRSARQSANRTVEPYLRGSGGGPLPHVGKLSRCMSARDFTDAIDWKTQAHGRIRMVSKNPLARFTIVKFEIRMSKFEANPNVEIRILSSVLFRDSDFLIVSNFGFR